jgi:selenocysteine lyase/cysteine desulfurase
MVTVKVSHTRTAEVHQGDVTGMNLATAEIRAAREALRDAVKARSAAVILWENACDASSAQPTGSGSRTLRAISKRSGEVVDQYDAALTDARRELERAVRVANPGRPELDINTALNAADGRF